MSDSADLFYPASSGGQSSTRDGHTSENVDQEHSSESVTSDNYYTPEEEGQFLPDFVVSLSCFFWEIFITGLLLKRELIWRSIN